LDQRFQESGPLVQGGFDGAEACVGRGHIVGGAGERAADDLDEQREGVADDVDQRVGDGELDCLQWCV